MQTQSLRLIAAGPGTETRLTVQRFGNAASGPKALIQAALHADEVPPLLVAHHLRERLLQLEAQGALRGQVLLLPYANPIGLGQRHLGQVQGRFDLRDGLNFNRGYADLAPAAIAAVAGRLGSDPAANTALIRAALCAAAQQLPAQTPAQDLKRQLLQLAADCDVVLDLHCENEAALHLYGLTPQAAMAAELGALLGARAILLATESGESPFDEACSQPWLRLQQQFGAAAVPLACFCTTVELRGEADTDHALARQDADALLEFLRRRGIVGGTPAELPPAQCQPTPLAASEPVTAPSAGVLVFHARPGEAVEAGAVIADLIDVDSGQVRPLKAQSAGVLYARIATRWAAAGTRVAKIAGTSLSRTGPLLGA